MKSLMLFLFFLLLLTSVSEAQVVDTAAVRRAVDSLLTLSQAFINKSDFNKALAENEVAENLAAKTIGKASELFGRCCFNHGRILHVMGDYPGSEKWLWESANIYEKTQGKESSSYAKSINNLAVLYSSMGNLEKAEPLYLETVAILEKNLGKEHSDYAGCLIGLGLLYFRKAEYTKAENFWLESRAIYEKTLGKENSRYALLLSNLAALYVETGQYEKAEPILLESKAIRGKILGKEHPDYAQCLHNLAILYYHTGHYESVEPLLLEAINIRRKALGERHPDFAGDLEILASLYKEMGQYEKSEPLYLKVISIREKSQGKEHPEYAAVLVNLAILYWDMGQYDKSELLYLSAIAIQEKVLPGDHPDYAGSLNNLATLYRDMGLNEKAEPLLIKVQTIFAKVLGGEHPDYAGSLYNLANLYMDMGRYEKAELILLEAKAIREKALGKEHPEYAATLHIIAILYSQIGRYEKAGPIFLEAIAIQGKTLGEKHPTYAMSLVNLSTLYSKIGKYEIAEQYLSESKTIFENTLGSKHPEYARSLKSLAILYSRMGQYGKAQPLYLELSKVNKTLLDKAIRHLSERELGQYLKKFSESQDLTLAATQLSKDKNATATCYDNGLFYKTFLLNATSQINRLANYNATSVEKFNLQKSYLRLLSKEYALPIAERDSSRIAEWEEKSNAIEKELVRTVAGYGDLIRQVSWQEVQQKLRPGEAAVELVSYHYYTPEPTDSTLYAALVLLPTDTAPHFIPLFEERQLQAVLNRPDLGEELTVKDLYATQSELLNLLWKPLEPLLRNAKTIYYSPAGLLHRINPAALRDANKRPLSEGRQWVRVGSTRELVTGRLADNSFAHDTTTSPTAAVWGGIRYDMDSTAFAAVNPFDPAAEPLAEFQRKDGKFRYMVEDSSTATLANRNAQRGSDDDSWEPLPGCEQEAQQVGELLRKAGFRTEVLSDYAASEERFKALGQATPSPRILHVATHGFAYPDPKKEPAKTLSGAEPTYKLQDDPMLRSGLLLAGANYYWKNKHPLENREDGVLVAYEVRDLNLRNTELAVLSACQTGLGDVVGSEGVYGLQRAFRIAGAKFLIVSLWQVPDEQTQELMRLFYENWVDKRESLRDAFNHAQTTLQEREPNPYMWAGFVLVE